MSEYSILEYKKYISATLFSLSELLATVLNRILNLEEEKRENRTEASRRVYLDENENFCEHCSISLLRKGC